MHCFFDKPSVCLDRSVAQRNAFTIWPLMKNWLIALLLLFWLAPATATPAVPAVAFFYADNAPLDELKAFDIVVVDPDHNYDPQAYRKTYSELYAYVGIGEAQPTRAWFKTIPPATILTENPDWGSVVLDLSRPEWADFVTDKIVAPLWDKGYRGFFLDTLDSYRLAKKFDENAQQAGLVAIIEKLHLRFPGIQLILNRGFDVVPKVKDKVQMVAAESLFRGWNAGKKRYVEIGAEEREWLLNELTKVRDLYGLPVLAIDYVPPQDRALTRATAERISALGIVPWVTDSDLATLGIGQREVVPRRLLMLYSIQNDETLGETPLVRFATMPANYLGYAADFYDINQPLPTGNLAGRYAGIVLWTGGNINRGKPFSNWLRRQIDSGLRVAVFGQFGFPLDAGTARHLGLVADTGTATGKLSVGAYDPALIGLEAQPRADRRALVPLHLAKDHGRSLLQVTDAKGVSYDAAAITRWGGYVLDPFAVIQIPGTEQFRWIIDPFAFLQQALALPALPVPDTTTENGRRLMFIHIDGDGYPSLAEMPGSPLAGKVLLNDVIEKYRLPTTMSVIEGEVAPYGLYPKLSAEMESLARRTFALPYVEIASHSFSHPFRWDLAEKKPGGKLEDESYHLDIPGYKFDLAREITGSIDYIRTRLAPPGKPVSIMLWTGDAEPQATAMKIAEADGLLNMNGGNTIISKAFPTLTAVSALGLTKGGVFQTYAPMMNENVYTNLWTGPFYGFERVIETFEMTETPRRLKPIDIYYHTYSATKRASLNALYKVYDWSLAQHPNIIHASEFIRKAKDFNSIVLAREGQGWRIRGEGELRTLHAPADLGLPDIETSSGVAGHTKAAEGNYIHLSGPDVFLRFAPHPAPYPYLREANARLTEWSTRDGNIHFTLKAYQAIEFALSDAGNCTVSANGKPITAHRIRENSQTFRLPHATATIDTRCRPR